MPVTPIAAASPIPASFVLVLRNPDNLQLVRPSHRPTVIAAFPKGSTAQGLPAARWSRGQTVAHTLTVRAGTHHQIVFKNQTGTARIHAQITGFYIPSRLPSVLVASGSRVGVTRDPSPVIQLTLPTGTFW